MSEKKDTRPRPGDANSEDREPINQGNQIELKSLSDRETYSGGKPDEWDTSLGDQVTVVHAGIEEPTLDSHLEVVDLNSRYKIERALGKGGMGEVLLATDTRLDRKVAIKRILSDASRSSTAINRFLTEAKSIAALNHPNIVQIHDYGRSSEGPFLIMEYVDGGNLLDRCRAGAIPLEEAISLACQLCEGLGRAHERGIIHRDIKPANILLTSDGFPKLTDFGLAKVNSGESEMTLNGAILGTLDFMPPEQRRDSSLADARSDLWSLAATLYQMVTGESPRVIDLDSVPTELRTPLARALKTKKEDRFQTTSEFKKALKDCLDNTKPLAFEKPLDIGAGECPSCHTLNEPHRKFCRECGDPLRCSCLKCEYEIPVWDKICPECGGKQSELLAARLQELELECNHAAELLEKLEFDAANDLAKRLGIQPDKRFQQLETWSTEFLKQIEIKKSEEYKRLEVLALEATRHEQAFDYKSALRSLEQVPTVLRETPIPSQRGETAASLLNRVKEKLERTRNLEAHIRQSIANRQVDDLENEVGQFLELLPHHKEMRRLQQQLSDRKVKLIAIRDEAISAAKELEKRKDYEGMSRELSRVDPCVITPEITRLKEEAARTLRKIKTLSSSIAKARADKDNRDLLYKVNELLVIKPNDAEMLKLQKQLVALEEKNSAAIREVVERVGELMRVSRFDQALEELSRIPLGLRTDQVTELGKTCARMSGEKLAAIAVERRHRTSKYLVIGFVVFAILGALSVLAVALHHQNRLSREAEADALAKPMAETGNKKILDSPQFRNSIGMELKLIHPGKFVMGSDFGVADQRPAHEVTLTSSFHIGTYEVTQEQYERVMSENPSRFPGARNPVDSVSWEDAVEFCNRLSALPEEQAAGRVYRLPTEAEWEYACRAGSTSRYCFGDDESSLPNYAWFKDNSGDTTHPVGQKKPNAWGVHDMHGNVWEWCSDRYGGYSNEAVTDPAGLETSADRVFRGGCWTGDAANCNSAFRNRYFPSFRNNDLGFRVALSFSSEGAKERADSETKTKTLTEARNMQILESPPISNSIGIKLKQLPPGKFVMGSDGGENNERDPHEVTLTQSFYIGVYEVTQEQYERVMGENPSSFKGPRNPVEQVSWEDAVEFCKRLSALPEEKAAGRVYRLPTEAEWEYACRAGSTSNYSFGDDESRLREYAWFINNSGSTTHPVGQKKPNAWGLYDMHGNVREWCSDWYGDYAEGAFTDPVGPEKGSARVDRGGGRGNGAVHCRSANRYGYDPSYRNGNVGFRLALSSP